MAITKDLLQEIVAHAPYDDELCFPIPSESVVEITSCQGEGILVSEGMLHLRDLGVKSKIIAEYHYNSLDTNSEFAFWEKVRDLLEDVHTCKELSVVEEYIFLGSLQRDIFLSAKNYIVDSENSHILFEILHVLKRAMNKQFLYSCESFMEFFIFVYEKAENDGAIGYYVSRCCEFLFADEGHCLKIYSLCLESGSRFAIPIYNNIAIKFYKKYSYMKDDLFKKIHDDESVSSNTIYLYGRILSDEGIHTGSGIDLLKIRAGKGADDQRHSAFSALALHLGKSQDVDSFFKQELASRNTQAIFALAHKLSLQYAEYGSHPDFAVWIESLAYIPSGARGAEESRDFLFSDALSNHYELIIHSLELCFSFYKEQSSSVNFEELFPSTLRRFAEKDFFSTQLLLWLNEKNHDFARIVTDIAGFMTVHQRQYPEFKIDKLDIQTPEDLLFLCRAILGYVYEVDFLLSSLTALARFYKDTPQLLDIVCQCIDSVAFDYPPQTQKVLEELQASCAGTSLGEMSKSIQDKMDGYFDALHNLPRVKEVFPSRSEEVLFQKEKHKSMTRQVQAAHENSVLYRLASTVPLKAGNAFFSCRNNLPDAPVPLISHETAFPLPRSILLDPVEYERKRLIFRLQTRGTL